MPELPEVETARRMAHAQVVGHRIVTAKAARDTIVFDGASPRAFAAAVRGRTVTGTDRRGKYQWLELDTRPWPVFHFGMTGDFHVLREGDASPRFAKCELVFDHGVRVVMTDPRRLGRIRLAMDPLAEPPVSRLGFDVLLQLPSARRFASLLRERKAPIKAVLLDQSFAAGVGNWIADEALYQAGLDPRRRACDVSEAEAARLRSRLRSIVQHACAVGADDARFPQTWLFHHRWGRVAGSAVHGGHVIEHITVGGRTTAWVPGKQQ